MRGEKIRCDHCGQWKELCSCFTLDLEIEDYGDFAVCPKCFEKHPSGDLEYWKKWRDKKKLQNK